MTVTYKVYLDWLELNQQISRSKVIAKKDQHATIKTNCHQWHAS